ncbi:glycine cleavage system H protein-like [Littorina saxatilis]|uniref:Glycine cleavage system H protein n=1 Tax=Littorina saxatilis TaxID=31220 RepID=A0AAN9C079_9CAEN
MAATMLVRLAKQTSRVTALALRQQTFVASCLQPFSSSRLLANKVFTEKHEWIELSDGGNVGTVGISDHAQESLGEIVYVQLPEIGTEVEKDGEAGCVESVKAASDIYSPAAGKIVGVNEALSDKPELINKSPLSDGWIFKVEVADLSELNNLMDESAYRKFLETEE